MISHASAHPNFVVLFLLPVIVLRMLAMLRRPVRPWRDGVVLGLLVAGQITLGEEPLLLFAIALALFSLVYYAHRPADGFAALKRLSKPVAIGALVALVLTGPALWWQFFGPQSYRLIDHGPMGNDLESFAQFPSESLGGVFAPGQNVAINPTEENAYFGWPLLVLVAAAAFWLWRNRVARAAAVTIAVLSVLSLGSTLHIGKTDTGIGLPWQWFERYPLIQSVLETRFAMACVPLIAVLLALGTERALRSWSAAVPWCVGLVVALGPLVPTPLPVVERSTTPAFFADGTWREFVADGSVVTVPLPRPESASALSWQRAADFGYPIAGGYFVGPAGAEQQGQVRPRRPAYRDAARQGRRQGRRPADRRAHPRGRAGGSAVLAGRRRRVTAHPERPSPCGHAHRPARYARAVRRRRPRLGRAHAHLASAPRLPGAVDHDAVAATPGRPATTPCSPLGAGTSR